MGRGHKKSDFEKLVARTHTYYFKIGSEYCPVLNSRIIFDERGWGHFFDDDHDKPEIIRRLNLFPHTRKIIRERTTPSKKNPHNQDILAHTLIETIDNKKVKVLIFQHGKEFWYVSVYEVIKDSFRSLK